MSNLAEKVLSVNNDLPIRSDLPVHSGKVRSVYWLTESDSRRLIEENNYEEWKKQSKKSVAYHLANKINDLLINYKKRGMNA